MINPITAIIVDDESDARDALNRLLKKEVDEITVVATAENAQSALEHIADKKPELIFLDIQMPGKNGFWLADKIGKLNLSTTIIFVTAYDKYLIEAIKHAAFDFLTKPVLPELLKKAIERFKEEKGTSNLDGKLKKLSQFLKKDQLKFNTHNGFFMISPENIIYCKAEGNYCNLFTTEGKARLVTSNLDSVGQKLPANSFVKINRSAVINTMFIEEYITKDKILILSDFIQRFELKVSSSGHRKIVNMF